LSGKPGNVRDFDSSQGMSGILPKVMEMAGKKSFQEKVAKHCFLLVTYLQPYGYLVASS